MLKISKTIIAADPDAVEIGKDYAATRAEELAGCIKALHRYKGIGERLNVKKDQVGHGNWSKWIETNKSVLGF